MPLDNPLTPAAPPVKTPREREAELVKKWDKLFLILLGPVYFYLKRYIQDTDTVRIPTYLRMILTTISILWVYVLYTQGLIFEASVRKETDTWASIFWWVALLIVQQWGLSVFALELWRIIYAGGIDMLRHWSRRELAAEKLERAVRDRALTVRDYQVTQSSGVPDAPQGTVPVGYCLEVIEAEVPQQFFFRSRNNFLSLHEKTFPQHILMLGAIGAGKTHYLQYLSHQILNNTSWDYFLVDGKGDSELADDINNRMCAAEPSRGPVPRVSFDSPDSSTYNPFSGDKNAICDRLSGMLGLDVRGTDGDWFRELQLGALQLICGIGYADHTYMVPRSFADIVDLCDIPTLKKRYKGKPRAQALLSRWEKSKDHRKGFDDLASRLGNFDRRLGQFLSADGFALEDNRGAIFSLASMSYGDTARTFTRLLIEDLKNFIDRRHTRPAVIVIDEFGEIGADNILTLLRMARSKNVGIILASQTVGSLGDADTRKDILETCRTKILMSLDSPEDLVVLAGTKEHQDLSVSIDNGAPTGKLTLKEVNRLKIDLNQVRMLSAGEAFIIRQGYVYKVRVPYPLPLVPPSPPAQAVQKAPQPSTTTWQPQLGMEDES